MLGQSSQAGLKILGEILKLLPIFFRFGESTPASSAPNPAPTHSTVAAEYSGESPGQSWNSNPDTSTSLS